MMMRGRDRGDKTTNIFFTSRTVYLEFAEHFAVYYYDRYVQPILPRSNSRTCFHLLSHCAHRTFFILLIK